jgi:hypothetical protein
MTENTSASEFERLLEAVKGRRNVPRDRCLVLSMFRRGLRSFVVCGVLKRVDVESRILHVARLNWGSPPCTLSGGRDPLI